jgi:hypothetical protein
MVDVDREVAQLVRAQAATRRQLVRQAIAHAVASARDFDAWYDHDAIRGWAETLAGQMAVYQLTLARSTDGYLSRVLGLILGVHRLRPVGAVDITGLRPGVTHPGVYGRAAGIYRWQQSRFDAVGGLLADPRYTSPPPPPVLQPPQQAAVTRVAEIADLDMQLAVRAQEHADMTAAAARGVEGYRRVLHPELSAGGVCGLCIAASDRLYSTADLRPIHARCECTVLPVARGQDPGSRLNDLDLRRLYKAAGGTAAAKLKATKWQVGEHGELGPVLQARGQARGPGQVERDTKPGPDRSPAEVARLVRQRRDTLARALPRARELARSDPKGWGGYLSQLEDRVAQLDREVA